MSFIAGLSGKDGGISQFSNMKWETFRREARGRIIWFFRSMSEIHVWAENQFTKANS